MGIEAIDVLALVAQSLSDKEIAERLTIEPTTVTTHVSHIIGKTDEADRRFKAAEWYRQNYG